MKINYNRPIGFKYGNNQQMHTNNVSALLKKTIVSVRNDFLILTILFSPYNLSYKNKIWRLINLYATYLACSLKFLDNK